MHERRRERKREKGRPYDRWSFMAVQAMIASSRTNAVWSTHLAR